MASTSALFTGLTGLSTNARRLEVIGNNIANSNTISFKSNRINFASAFSRTFSLGTQPSNSNGGSNPGQIGLGAQFSNTQRDTSNGAINPTGIATDLAMQGEGFFIVEDGGDQLFTRDGSFQLNSENELVSSSGGRVQGYAVDENFQILEGDLLDVVIPVGSLSIAEESTRVVLAGNLNVQNAGNTGALAPQGSVHTLGTLLYSAAATPAIETTLLTAATDNAGAANYFDVGDTITIESARRGNKTLPPASYTVTATSNVKDLMNFYQAALGVVDQGGFALGDPGPNDGGVTIDALGEISIAGNIGTFNDLDLSRMVVGLAPGATGTFTTGNTKTQTAQGESIRTTVTVYDSVGTAIPVDVTLAFVNEDTTGHQARMFVHASDDADLNLALENGGLLLGTNGTDPLVGYSAYAPLLRFDTQGQIDPTTAEFAVQVDRTALGAEDPLAFTIDFSEAGDSFTGFAAGNSPSAIRATSIDGLAFGVLEEFAVQGNGVIRGFFSNGQTRDIGQVMIATFQNPEGLIDEGNNLFRAGPNSGTPQVTVPTQQGAGEIVGGSLELSNVDLSEEFINMILTSTGYNASSRVISTSDQLLQTLIALAR